jgi:hypothetical protein
MPRGCGVPQEARGHPASDRIAQAVTAILVHYQRLLTEPKTHAGRQVPRYLLEPEVHL